MRNGRVLASLLVVTLVTPLFGACGERSKEKERGGRMQRITVAVDKIAGFDVPTGADDAILRLAGGQEYRILRRDPHFDYYARLLPKEESAGRLIYVEALADTRVVQHLDLPVLRRIDSVAASVDGGRLAVLIRRSPSQYFLRADHPDVARIRACLEEAVKNQEAILVTSTADTLEIIDARRPPAGYEDAVI